MLKAFQPRFTRLGGALVALRFVIDTCKSGDTNSAVFRRNSSTRSSLSPRILLASFVAASGMLLAQPADTPPVDLNRALAAGNSAYASKDYAAAVENFTIIVEATPNGMIENLLYKLAYSHYYLLNYPAAAEAFENFVKKYPSSQFNAEVNLTLGRTLLQLEGKEDQALASLAKAAEKPEFAEEARFLAADAYIKKGDMERAEKTLQSAMNANSSGPGVLRASLQLVDLYIAAADYDKAIAMLSRLEASDGYPDVIVTVNHRFVQIGDKLLEEKEYSKALNAYSNVRPRNQVIAVQRKRLEVMRAAKTNVDKQIADATRAKKELPYGTEDRAAIMAAMIENTDKVLGEVVLLNEYDATLQYRIGRCFFNMERFWPAAVAFESVARENPESTDASTSLFGAIISQWKLQRFPAARKLSLDYLSLYPEEKFADQVAELNATLLLEEGLTTEAITFIDSYLQANPSTPIREKLLTLLANGRFQAGKFDEAAKDYDALRKEFPSSSSFEDFSYRRTLCDFFRNDYSATVKGFDSFERDFPKSGFLADIQYRRGIILLAKKEYGKLITSMSQLLKDSNASGFAGQIHTLLGDAFAAKGDSVSAGTSFANAVRTANKDPNVLQYALDQATTLLRGARRWDELEALWKDFLKNNPNDPMELRGVSELAKLQARANKKDEARKMLSEYALRDIHNVRSEYVEMLLSQLANQFVPPRSFKKDAEPPNVDALLADLNKALEIPEDAFTPTYVARVNFAKAEFSRMMRDPVRNARFLNAIATSSKPEDLGPTLLSVVGQFLLDDKQLDQAAPLFIRLREAFPDSIYADAAPVGLGEIALQKKDYEGAVKEFDAAITDPNGASMLKEATYGKAVALMALKNYDEAKKLFDEIVINREWRGMEKAGSLLNLGEIEAEKGNKGAAHNQFQRVYLSHGAYPNIAAKAYLRAAEMLEEDGKHDEAQKTLKEFVENPKFANTPEIEKAKEKIE